MQDKILSTLQRFWRGFLAFTPGQKVVTVAVGLALVVGGFAFSSWASKPSYAPLFTNLAPADASGIIDKLNATKTPYKLAANGTSILVPQKDVYDLRLNMSAAGLPSSGSSGYSLLDQEGITTSEFKQHVDYQRALEGELSKTIKSISGVRDAAVHLAIPQQSVFTDGTQKTTGSVLLTTDPGATLTSGQVQSVVNLVSSSVPGLAADQVSVSDASGKVLSVAGDANSGAAADTRTEAIAQYNKRISGEVQQMLDRLVGAGHSVVTVNADLDFDKNNTVSDSYVYATGIPPLSEANTTETYGPGQNGAGGVLGAASPSPTRGCPAPARRGRLPKTTTTRDNAVDESTETRNAAPGKVRASSAWRCCWTRTPRRWTRPRCGNWSARRSAWTPSAATRWRWPPRRSTPRQPTAAKKAADQAAAAAAASAAQRRDDLAGQDRAGGAAGAGRDRGDHDRQPAPAQGRSGRRSGHLPLHPQRLTWFAAAGTARHRAAAEPRSRDQRCPAT